MKHITHNGVTYEVEDGWELMETCPRDSTARFVVLRLIGGVYEVYNARHDARKYVAYDIPTRAAAEEIAAIYEREHRDA